MIVFARRELCLAAPADGDPALLLEGSWPLPSAGGCRSLDDSIDARHAWIDVAAAELAEQAAGTTGALNFAFLNALALRYYLVKLLRVIAFVGEVWRPPFGERVVLHLTAGRDEDYADLFAELGRLYGLRLSTHWHDAAPVAVPRSRANWNWRRWVPQAGRWSMAKQPEKHHGAPRVVLCGNPRVLDPICRQLLHVGCQVWWLHERFAFRCWWRWRSAGAHQLACDARRAPWQRFSDGWSAQDVTYRGVNLAAPLERWLNRRADELAVRQSQRIVQIERYFSRVQPTVVVLDEDATPFKRAAIGLARRWQAASLVVQHGAPCVAFGFAPLAADGICVWGASSRRQLMHWGIDDDRIQVTGSPSMEPTASRLRAAPRTRQDLRARHVLLLATVSPSDGRPDAVSFHLTGRTHDEMLRMALAAVARIDGARLTIKLHPRTRDDTPFWQIIKEFPQVKARLCRSTSLEQLVPQSDCVLSCASTAGIEAALAGAPVIQLLPAGSGDILPADEWGLLGSARTPTQLDALLARALDRGWRPPVGDSGVLDCSSRPAVQRVIDVLLQSCGAPATLAHCATR